MNDLKKILLVLFSIIGGNSFAQSDLRLENNFFQIKIDEYSQWLDAKKFSQVIVVDSFRVFKEKVSVYLGSAQNAKKDFYLNVAWQALKDKVENNSNLLLEETLFNNLFFTLELPPDSIDIFILGKKTHLFSVEIFSLDNQIYVDDKIAEARSPEMFTIPLIDLKTKYVKKDKIKDANLNKITDEIQNFLREYYKNKGAWWYYADVEVIEDFEHKIILEITDLKGEILKNERQYFEYIRISVKVEKQGKNVVLTYDLMAKYGSGIFLAPRSTSDYKNMEIKYAERLENYKTKIKSLIHKHLTK